MAAESKGTTFEMWIPLGTKCEDCDKAFDCVVSLPYSAKIRMPPRILHEKRRCIL